VRGGSDGADKNLKHRREGAEDTKGSYMHTHVDRPSRVWGTGLARRIKVDVPGS
jgi:hypothetical protein